MALSSNALCAKAKAMYGYRLNEESYSDLCRKQTLGEMVTYLKSQTKYSDVLKDCLLYTSRKTYDRKHKKTRWTFSSF